MKQILCLSSESWSNKLPGRTQQLVSRLRDARILYFSPAKNWRDVSFRRKGQKVRPNVTAYTMPPIPFPIPEARRLLFQMAWNRVGRFVRETAERRHFSEPLLWTTNPRQIHLPIPACPPGLPYPLPGAWDPASSRTTAPRQRPSLSVSADRPSVPQALPPASPGPFFDKNTIWCPCHNICGLTEK